jgi:hypothetical protein
MEAHEIKEFIKQAVAQVKAGANDAGMVVSSEIKFELDVRDAEEDQSNKVTFCVGYAPMA